MKISFCIITNAALSAHQHRLQYLYQLLGSIINLGIEENQLEIIIGGAVPPKLPCISIHMEELAKEGRVCHMRNELIRKSTGEVIILCDDDVLITAGYWNAVQQRIGNSTWDILCTKLLNPNGTRYWDWAAYQNGKGQTLVPYNCDDPFIYATGGHAIYRRNVFRKVTWNETLKHGDNEEFDFAANARKAGLKYVLETDATVYLQYHHCDAEAVINRIPQRGQEQATSEYLETKASALRRHIQIVQSSFPQLWNRLSNKFTYQAAQSTLRRPSVSIVTCCHRYLQRFRIFAEGWLRQKFEGAIEVCVANPGSSDGLSDYISTLNLLDSNVKFIDVSVENRYSRNRGYLINCAYKQSCAPIVIGMDCDIVVPGDFCETMESTLRASPFCVMGVYRNFLSEATTNKIITGLLNPFEQFHSLLDEDHDEPKGYRGVLGYCQAASRAAWQSVLGYPTEFNDIARSDIAFIERLESLGYTPRMLKSPRVLHLHHVRDWSGSSIFQ